MIRTFKSRGHFCNYCRKILSNKLIGYNHLQINQAIWFVWDSEDKELQNQLVNDLSKIDITLGVRMFNNSLKVIKHKYLGDKEYRNKTQKRY